MMENSNCKQCKDYELATQYYRILLKGRKTMTKDYKYMYKKIKLCKRLLELRKFTQEALDELKALGKYTAAIIEYGDFYSEEDGWDEQTDLFTARVYSKDGQARGEGVSKSAERAFVLATLKYLRNQVERTEDNDKR